MKKYKNKSNLQIISDYLNGERPFVTVGYTAPEITRKEGDTWTDNNGVKWEQKNGFQIRINENASIIKSAIKQRCDCGQEIQYGGKLDELFYSKTGKCFECILKEENDLRILGVYPQYERYKLLSNYLGFLNDMKMKIKDSIEYLKNENSSLDLVCNSAGFIEKFRGMNTTELLESAVKDLEEITKTIEIVTKDTAGAKEEYLKDLDVSKKFFSSKKKKRTKKQ